MATDTIIIPAANGNSVRDIFSAKSISVLRGARIGIPYRAKPAREGVPDVP